MKLLYIICVLMALSVVTAAIIFSSSQLLFGSVVLVLSGATACLFESSERLGFLSVVFAIVSFLAAGIKISFLT